MRSLIFRGLFGLKRFLLKEDEVKKYKSEGIERPLQQLESGDTVNPTPDQVVGVTVPAQSSAQ
jgi:hypothetical protein